MSSSPAIQLAVGSSSGSPARNSARRLERSYLCSHAGSCFFSTRMAVGAENITVTLYFSTSCHQMPASGRIGSPSYTSVVMPFSSGPYTM
ncbi:hypothetical protein D3C72_1985070 [compost metagenome]